ncbi:hypothetical protein M9Y10_041723 [Tritrichomonas musculus]|uniref:Uncharacterized protein n=1 Tax=Tritrichomonas musculus TaxID=1915356 RepID=A0ABR2K619_9EUKA
MDKSYQQSQSQSKCFTVDPSTIGQQLQRPSAHHNTTAFGNNFPNRSFFVAKTALNAQNNSIFLNMASCRPLDIPVLV